MEVLSRALPEAAVYSDAGLGGDFLMFLKDDAEPWEGSWCWGQHRTGCPVGKLCGATKIRSWGRSWAAWG